LKAENRNSSSSNEIITSTVPLDEQAGDDNDSMSFKIELKTSLRLDQFTQTDLEDENLTLVEYLEKYEAGIGAENVVDGTALMEVAVLEEQVPTAESEEVQAVEKEITPTDANLMVAVVQSPVGGEKPQAAGGEMVKNDKVVPRKIMPTTNPVKYSSVVTRNLQNQTLAKPPPTIHVDKAALSVKTAMLTKITPKLGE
jgi:hypothetical protein